MYSQDKIQQLVDKIKDSIQPDKIYLFGSYASGTPSEHSDIDICIIKNDSKDKNQELIKVKKATYYLGIPMDILLFKEKDFAKRKDIWGSVQYEIFHKGKKLYER
ncbi:MAG: nucleotidyltransferase domain-containing protein [bacterium]